MISLSDGWRRASGLELFVSVGDQASHHAAQDLALVGLKRREELVCGGIERGRRPLLDGSSLGRELNRVGATVRGVPPPHDYALRLEIVDQFDHGRPIDAQLLAQLVLRDWTTMVELIDDLEAKGIV